MLVNVVHFTRAQSLTRPYSCATCNWLLHPAHTSAQGGLDSVQLVQVVFILPSISAKTSLALAWASPATCAGGGFSFINYYCLLMFTHAHEHFYKLHCVVLILCNFLYKCICMSGVRITKSYVHYWQSYINFMSRVHHTNRC